MSNQPAQHETPHFAFLYRTGADVTLPEFAPRKEWKDLPDDRRPEAIITTYGESDGYTDLAPLEQQVPQAHDVMDAPLVTPQGLSKHFIRGLYKTRAAIYGFTGEISEVFGPLIPTRVKAARATGAAACAVAVGIGGAYLTGVDEEIGLPRLPYAQNAQPEPNKSEAPADTSEKDSRNPASDPADIPPYYVGTPESPASGLPSDSASKETDPSESPKPSDSASADKAEPAKSPAASTPPAAIETQPSASASPTPVETETTIPEETPSAEPTPPATETPTPQETVTPQATATETAPVQNP